MNWMKAPSLKELGAFLTGCLAALGCAQGVLHPARLPNWSPILLSRKFPVVLKAPPSTVGWGSPLLPPNRDCQSPQAQVTPM